MHANINISTPPPSIQMRSFRWKIKECSERRGTSFLRKPRDGVMCARFTQRKAHHALIKGDYRSSEHADTHCRSPALSHLNFLILIAFFFCTSFNPDVHICQNKSCCYFQLFSLVLEMFGLFKPYLYYRNDQIIKLTC